MPRARISASEARRAALAAQGFAEPRRPDGRAIRRLFDRVGLAQIDSVNVLARAHDDAWGGMRRVARERPQLLRDVLEQVRERGPVAARDLAEQRPRRAGPWWDWSESKKAIELLFWSGEVTSARRRETFERLYDLSERVLPRAVLDAPTPATEDAQRALVRVAARALGV